MKCKQWGVSKNVQEKKMEEYEEKKRRRKKESGDRRIREKNE